MFRCQERAVPVNPVAPWVCGIAAGAVAMVLAVQAGAVTPEEHLFMKYHQAIYAAAECEGLPLYQEGPRDPNGPVVQDYHQTMASIIADKVEKPTDELSMIEEAKSDAHDLIIGAGCDSSEVTELRSLFHAELAPALNLPVEEG